MSNCHHEECHKPCCRPQRSCVRRCEEVAEARHGFVSSSFANAVALVSGVFQFMGINTVVAGSPASAVDARLLNDPQEIHSLRVTLGSALPPGVSIVVSLEVSRDNGASYTSIAALVIGPGLRSNSASFELLLPARSLHCIGLLAAGGGYTGPISATIS